MQVWLSPKSRAGKLQPLEINDRMAPPVLKVATREPITARTYPREAIPPCETRTYLRFRDTLIYVEE